MNAFYNLTTISVFFICHNLIKITVIFIFEISLIYIYIFLQ